MCYMDGYIIYMYMWWLDFTDMYVYVLHGWLPYIYVHVMARLYRYVCISCYMDGYIIYMYMWWLDFTDMYVYVLHGWLHYIYMYMWWLDFTVMYVYVLHGWLHYIYVHVMARLYRYVCICVTWMVTLYICTCDG